MFRKFYEIQDQNLQQKYSVKVFFYISRSCWVRSGLNYSFKDYDKGSLSEAADISLSGANPVQLFVPDPDSQIRF